MSTYLKYTEVFPLNSEAQRAAAAIMSKLSLKETQRVIIGNDPKNLFVVLTWEGRTDNLHIFKDAHIKSDRRHKGVFKYYHRYFLNGEVCSGIDELKRKIKHYEDNDGYEFNIETL